MKRVRNRTRERRRRGLTVRPPPAAPRAEAAPTPKWPSLAREEPPWSARAREREAEAGEGMKVGLAGFGAVQAESALAALRRDLCSPTWRTPFLRSV